MSRIDTFRTMVAKNPTNLLAHYGLANEALKDELWEEAHAHLVIYLAGMGPAPRDPFLGARQTALQRPDGDLVGELTTIEAS